MLVTQTPHRAQAPYIHSKKGHKDTKSPSSKSQDTTKTNVWMVVHPQTGGSCICFWSSWQTAEQTLQAAQVSTDTAEWNHPFGKCQSLWLTSCCKKHGKDSVSLWLLLLRTAERIHKDTLSPPNLTVTEVGIPSPWKQNQGKTSQAWSSLSIHASSTWGD